MRPYRGIEHRKSKRVRYRMVASYRIVNERDRTRASSPQKGIIVDISLTGLRMLVKSPRADGLHITGQVVDKIFAENHLSIEFRLDYKDRQSIKLLGQFVRYERENLSGEYRFAIGVRYLDVSREDLERIKEFLQSPSQDEGVRKGSPAPGNKG